MRRVAFIAAYLTTVAIPVALYLGAVGGGLDAYSASVALGAAAFALVCDQFILASRPALGLAALGQRGLAAFHGTAPVFILALAGAHKALKEAYGFSTDTAQAALGAVAWWGFALAAAFALALMAVVKPPLAEPLRRLRAWVNDRLKLGYKTARLFHNVTAAAGLAVTAHVLLASSSDLTTNPLGAAWMAGWMALSLGLYARYRLRGRKA